MARSWKCWKKAFTNNDATTLSGCYNPTLFEERGGYGDEGTQAQGLGVSDLSFQKILSPLLGATPKKKKKKSKLVYHQEKSGHLRYRRHAMVRYFNISLPPSWVSQVEVISAQHPEDGMTV